MRVLMAIDGSEDAKAAMEWLGEFPLPPQSHVRVLQATASADALPHGQVIAEMARQAVEAARVVLARHWRETDGVVVEGDPREAIIQAAEAWPADLLVVGARGLGAIKSFLLGSVSTAVVRHASCPVLVVKGQPTLLRRAVVAIDGSPDSLAAVRFFASLPLSRELDVRLIAVVRPPAQLATPEVPTTTMWTMFEDLVREGKTKLESVLTKVADDHLRARVRTVEQAIVLGHPADEVWRAASEPGVDLLVVGARGLGAVKRLLLGSVSESLLHHASCSMLVVKGPRG
jgi:nucleotide-binding universal stress UspA family protein